MYLRNSWYAVAWVEEIDRSLSKRTVMAEDIVLYRTLDGRVAALEDACCHRKLPLSMGVLIDDRIQCGYHGMEYDCSGTCVKIPIQTRIPPGTGVRSYPVEERWGLVWLWMGAADAADRGKIMEVDHYDDPDWGINRGPMMRIACDYRYMADNLLDPEHVSYVHKTSLGNEDCMGVPLEVSVDGDGIISRRWIKDCTLAPFFQPYVQFKGRADRLQHYEVRLPSSALIKDIIAPQGTGAPDGALHGEVFLLDSYNFITPVNADECMYFWFQVRNFKANCRQTDAALTRDFEQAFSEDVVILSAVHKGIKEARVPPINIASDTANLRYRRLLDKAIESEQTLV